MFQTKKRIMKTCLAIIFVGVSCISAEAEIKLPRLFGDSMILQQKQKNAVWGWTDAGKTVSVSASWGATATTMTGGNGVWRVFLDTPEFGTGHSLQISDGTEAVEVHDVAIGEVWLCVGQSNMGWGLSGTFSGEKDAASANHLGFRIFRSCGECFHEPLDLARDRLARWSRCTPEVAASTSAVSFYFGRKLHQELNVPVGIIVRAYSGTPIEGWMPIAIQLDDPRTAALIESVKQQDVLWLKRARLTREQALENYERELADYNEKIDAGQKTYKVRAKEKRLVPPRVKALATENRGHAKNKHDRGMIRLCLGWPRPTSLPGPRLCRGTDPVYISS